MRLRSIAPILALVLAPAAGRATTPVTAETLVDLQDNPPYLDALGSELERAGLSGSETIPQLSILDEGVRVMPVRVGISGELAQIATLLSRVSGEEFPFRSRIGELSLGRNDARERSAKSDAFHAEVMLLAPVRPRHGEPLDEEVAARVAADLRHGEALSALLSGLLTARNAAPWLLTLRVDGHDVAIEGTIPDPASADSIVSRVLALHGFVVSEVIGPQVDEESRRTVFLALGRLDASAGSSEKR